MTMIEGRCHCGAVRFTVNADVPFETSRCNCSMCLPARFWKTIVPADAFTLEASGSLRTYRFGSGMIEHCFCGTCGVKTHGQGEMEGIGPFVAVNVASLDLAPDVLAELPVEYQDGARDAHERAPSVSEHL